MGFWAFWFWVILVIFFEVLSARYATYALGLVLGLILCLAGFLFGSGFDLLVVMVILTYGSVFILLSLLLTQFSFLAGGAQRGTFQRFNPFWILAFGVIFCFFFLGGGVTSHPVAGSWALSVLWQDLVGMGGSDLSFVGLLVHELLYRFFFFETIWANVFLVLIFVVYALLLKSRGSFFLEKTLRSGFFLLGVAAWRKRWTSYQARALYHPRRQVRRQANSAVRHRV